MKPIAANLTPSGTRFFYSSAPGPAGLCATLRGRPSLALQSKKIGTPFQSEVDPSKTHT